MGSGSSPAATVLLALLLEANVAGNDRRAPVAGQPLQRLSRYCRMSSPFHFIKATYPPGQLLFLRSLYQKEKKAICVLVQTSIFQVLFT
jgi:hypothetical protein